jgi:Tat protein translocase TatC
MREFRKGSGDITGSFPFADEDEAQRPLRQVHGLPRSAYQITTFSPAEPFMVSLKVWVAAGLVLASPFLIWQLWAFVGPAFTPAQKRYFYPVVAACSLLFLGGAALACFLVLPKGLQWLYGVGSGIFNVQNRAADYFTFVALFVLAFGAVFEMPVVLVLLARLGIDPLRGLHRGGTPRPAEEEDRGRRGRLGRPPGRPGGPRLRLNPAGGFLRHR